MFEAIAAGLLGLVIGSFLNVVIYRVPRGESIVLPGSHCPQCGHRLRAWELVPVFSFFLLRGRCRVCKADISWRYSLVEVLTGCLFFLKTYLDQGFSLGLLFDLIFVSFLLVLTFIDIDHFLLPDVLVFPLLVLGLLRIFVVPGEFGWLPYLVGVVVAGGGFWLIAKLYPKGLGFGDVKLVAALGAYLGFPKVLAAIFLASFFGSVIGGLGILVRGKGFRQEIPFGPYLALGALIMLYWGDYLFEVYFRWLGA